MSDELSQEDRLPDVVRPILASYEPYPDISNIGGTALPSRAAVVEILDDLQAVVFPGYFGVQRLKAENIDYHIGARIDKIYAALSRQVFLAIRHTCTLTKGVCTHCQRKAEDETLKLLEKTPKIRGALDLDVKAAYAGDPAAKSYDEIIFSYPGLYAIFVNRVAHELYLQEIPLLPRIMSEEAHSRTGIDIHPGARIGKSFFIDHGTGVVIGETTEIGDNVRLYHGVTLGARSVANADKLRGAKRHPTIEDDVTVYPNATILGGRTVIGARSIIGGNVWITKSVPADTQVILGPQELHYLAATPAPAENSAPAEDEK